MRQPATRVSFACLAKNLNFFHTAFVSAILATIVHVVVSLATKPDAEKSKLTWTELGGHDPKQVQRAVTWLVVTLVLYAVLGAAMVYESLTPTAAGLIAAGWVFMLFVVAARTALAQKEGREVSAFGLLTEDRTWAGLLIATAVFMLYYFY